MIHLYNTFMVMMMHCHKEMSCWMVQQHDVQKRYQQVHHKSTMMMHRYDALTYLLGGEAGILVGANHDANVYGLTANQNEC